jgi:hypothetical protein
MNALPGAQLNKYPLGIAGREYMLFAKKNLKNYII